MAHAIGHLDDGGVTVSDPGQASRLTDKGSYGLREDQRLHLDLLEAAYLVEADRLEVRRASGQPVELPALIGIGAQAIDGFETSFLAYRDYRSRGFVVRRGDHGDFDGWARGAAPPRQHPAALIAPRSEGARASPRQLVWLIERAESQNRGLLLSVVDEESDVTYYEAGPAVISGKVPDPAPELASQARARLLRDRALIFEDPGLGPAGYGNEAGSQRFLSLAEAHHLAEHGMPLTDPEGRAVQAEDVARQAGELHPEGELVLSAYSWLRARDLVPKTGLKFGVHYRVYKGQPGSEHAPFLVQALADETPWTYREVARLVRLSHSVRKRPVIWSPAGALTVEWTRP